MRSPHAVSLTLILCCVPATAFAQSAGDVLGNPTTGRMPDRYFAAEAEEAVETSAQARSSQQARASRGVTGVDPEILELRSGEPREVRASGSGSRWSVQSGDWAPAPERRRGTTFGESYGHAWAGFGFGVVGGATLGMVVTSPIMGIFGGMIYGTALGAMTIAPLGAALATWGWGDLEGGTGNFFASLGMSYAGAGIGVAAAFALGLNQETGWAAVMGPLLGTVLSTFGAAIGYQITNHGPADEPRTASNDDVMIVPTLAPAEQGQGGTVGVAGTF